MSLTRQLFIHREYEMDTRKEYGEIELESFLKKHGLTETGEPFLRETLDFQLLFIKNEKLKHCSIQ